MGCAPSSSSPPHSSPPPLTDVVPSTPAGPKEKAYHVEKAVHINNDTKEKHNEKEKVKDKDKDEQRDKGEKEKQKLKLIPVECVVNVPTPSPSPSSTKNEEPSAARAPTHNKSASNSLPQTKTQPTSHTVVAASSSSSSNTSSGSSLLVCSNCDDAQLPLSVVCLQCSEEQEQVMVLCKACNHELHQFAKTRSHTRQPIGNFIHVGPSPTSHLPLVCTNCDSAPPAVWCLAQCSTTLCADCAKQIHAPKVARAHKRIAMQQQCVLDKFSTSDDNPPSTSQPSSTAPATKPAQPSQHSPKASPTNATKATAAAATTTKTTSPSSEPPAKPKRRIIPPSTETSEIMPVLNAGQEGDAMMIADPALIGPVNEEVLEFRNVVNPYDNIGAVQIVQISCGMNHTGAVTAYGSLFMWGLNDCSQLGLGEAFESEKELRVPQLIEFPRHAPIRMVACGAVHSLCLTQQGEVYSWGSGAMGVLGHESDADRPAPVRVNLQLFGGDVDKAGQEEVTYIACGQHNSGCVVKGRADHHQLYMWGEAACGQIGNGDMRPQLTPCLVKVEHAGKMPIITRLAIGTKHAVAVSSEGQVFTWGSNEFGNCGYVLPNNDGDNLAIQPTPKLVEYFVVMGTKIKDVACGERHTTCVSTVGDVWSFGSGESHQLGILDNVDQFNPVKAEGISNIVHVSVGAAISTAVNEQGETFMWGWGVENPVPSQVQGLKGHFLQQAHVGANNNIALLTGVSKELYEWQFDGNNMDEDETHGTSAGEVDDDAGATQVSDRDPLSVKPVVNHSLRGKKLMAISAGKSHWAAVTADNKLYVWGSAYEMQLGVLLGAGLTFMPVPIEARIQQQVCDVKCGTEHTIVLTTQGNVMTCGTGFEGRLGHVSNADVMEYKMIEYFPSNNIKIRSIAVGPSNCGAISDSGALFLWGANNAGQCANDNFLPQFKPNQVVHLKDENIESLAIGNNHMIAMTATGKLFAWGENRFCNLGISSYTEENAAYPQPVDEFNVLGIRPSMIACGDNVCLVLANGHVYGWGSGETAQILVPEDQMGQDVPSPTKLEFPFYQNKQSVTSISVQYINCSCITSSGDVWTWGFDFGEPRRLEMKQPKKTQPKVVRIQQQQAADQGQEQEQPDMIWEKIALGHTRMLMMT